MYNTTSAQRTALETHPIHMRLLAEAVPLMVPTAVPLQDSTGSQLFVLAADRLPGGKLEQDEILSMSYTASCCGGDIGIGGVYAAALSCTVNGTLSLLDMKIRVEIGAEVDGSVEWLPLGTFVVTDCRRTDDQTTITAYDATHYALGGGYLPGLDSGSTVAAVLADLAEQCGLTVEQTTLDMATMTVSGSLSGHTCREMLGYLAALCGKNAVVTREGAIRFVWFAKSGEAVTPDNYYSGELSNGGAAKLAGLTCTVPGEDEDSREGQTLTAGDSTLAVTVECPYMTQSRLDSIWSEVGGYAYPMADIGYYGGALTEPGDIVEVTNREGVTVSVPVMQVQLSMDGGCKCQISAYGQSVAEKTSRVKGPTEKAVEQLKETLTQEKTDRKTALKTLEEAVKSAKGLYSTKKTEDGATKYYLHDKPALTDSQLVVGVTSAGVSISNDGGQTVAFGFNFVTGDAIAATISADTAWIEEIFAQDITATGTIRGLSLETGDNFSVDEGGNLNATNATVKSNLYLYDSMNDVTYTIEADGGLGTNSDFYIGGDLTVNGDAHGLDGIFTIKAQSISIPEVAAGDTDSGAFGVSVAGYKPIGIAGWTTGTATGNSLFSVPRLYLDGTTCHYLVRNMHASNMYSCTLTVYVLYVKY